MNRTDIPPDVVELLQRAADFADRIAAVCGQDDFDEAVLLSDDIADMIGENNDRAD